MRIVLVNWARIWEGAAQGGGVNQYVQALAIELLKRGHDVVSLCGGATHTPPTQQHANSASPPPAIIRHPDWMGIKVFEVINSPVLAPSLAQFERPLDEVSAPALEKVVGELFDHLRPAVVHWNALEGFSIGCVSTAATAGARNIFSLHNYHTLCPQVYFLRGHRVLCRDFDNGHACASCVKIVPVSAERAKYHNAFDKSYPDTDTRVIALSQATSQLRDSLRWLPASLRAGASLARLAVQRPTPTNPLTRIPNARPVRSADDSTGSFPHPGPSRTLTNASGSIQLAEQDTRGASPHLLAELAPPPPADLSLPQFQPITNDIAPEPPSSKPPNDYAKRRAAMVEMLNACDRVLAVSSFVHRKFASMGVRDDKLATLPIGSRINRVVALKRDLVFSPPPFDHAQAAPASNGSVPSPSRPICLHFMGYNNYYKGLDLFILALEELEPEYLRYFHVSVFALDGHMIEWMFRRIEPRLAGLKFGYAYSYHDIPWMLGGKDLTVVPSVWWDNAPQTVFESFACGVPVLGADIGGIPDFVQDGVNGRLFRANDREDLKRVLRDLVRRPWQLNDLRANVRSPKSIEDHAAEVERVYEPQPRT
ncbi:MAG: glycosyltransferase [Phycisphaeraceae bacterium]|nr:glycosyltransferase [Phycisphaeraceae bacterium]